LARTPIRARLPATRQMGIPRGVNPAHQAAPHVAASILSLATGEGASTSSSLAPFPAVDSDPNY